MSLRFAFATSEKRRDMLKAELITKLGLQLLKKESLLPCFKYAHSVLLRMHTHIYTMSYTPVF